MSSLSKNRGWLRFASWTVGLYLLLWVATMVIGPGATRRAAQDRLVDEYTSRGWNPSNSQLELHSISVPAPFIVRANWTNYSLLPNGQRSGGGTNGKSLTLWLVVWARVMKHEEISIFCGTAMPPG